MNDKEIFLHIDFNGKLDPSIFNNKDLHFKIINLHKKNPLVQVDNYIFQGEYNDCLGTNIYYEANEDNQEKQDECPFKFQAPISLEYLTKSNKILKLKLCKLPDILHIPESENVDLKFKDDYKTVIKKMKEGKLSIDDIIENKEKDLEELLKEDLADSSMNDVTNQDFNNEESEVKMEMNNIELDPNNIEVLTNLAKKPMKTKKKLENAADVLLRDETNSYSFLKQLYLQNLHYKKIPLNIDENKLHLYIDIDNSIKNGIVGKSNFQKLTEEEKNKLISLENLENLAIPIQLALLVHQMKEEKNILLKMTEEELLQVDEYGRTPKERYRILKYFAKDTWYHMFRRYKDNDLMEEIN